MPHFLLRQAAKAIAGSAAPQVASQVAGRIGQRLTAPAARGEERRRFLIWLAGPFRQSQPDRYERLWPRLRERDEAVDALTGVFLELQSADAEAMIGWFAQLAESDQRHFDELIAALTPKPPDAGRFVQQASQEAESSLRGAARLLGRTWRRTSEQAREQARNRKR